MRLPAWLAPHPSDYITELIDAAAAAVADANLVRHDLLRVTHVRFPEQLPWYGLLPDLPVPRVLRANQHLVRLFASIVHDRSFCRSPLFRGSGSCATGGARDG